MLSVGLGQAAGFFQLGGTVAPGVRYWVHRHIALSTLLGLQAGITLQGKAGQTVLLSLLGTAGCSARFSPRPRRPDPRPTPPARACALFRFNPKSPVF